MNWCKKRICNKSLTTTGMYLFALDYIKTWLRSHRCASDTQIRTDSHRCRSRRRFVGMKDLHEKFMCDFCLQIFSHHKVMKTFFWCDLQNKVLHVFFCKCWGPIFEIKQRWAPIFPDFHRYFPDFQGFCLEFQGFCH